VSSWSCRYELRGLCTKLDGAYCRPGMKGCILVGKVVFQDGVVPAPQWPPGTGPAATRRRRPDPAPADDTGD